MPKYFVFAVSALMALAACTTATKSNPPRTATEEMLISAAADRAADQLNLKIKPHARVFVDVSNFEGTDSKYAISAIRTHLLKQGAYVVDDKKKAQIVVELRSGALSTDNSDFLIGIPSFNIPIPLATNSLATPEIAFYKDAEQQGVAKFAATSYDAKRGSLIAADDPQYGATHVASHTVLIFVSWKSYDGVPEDPGDRNPGAADTVTQP